MSAEFATDAFGGRVTLPSESCITWLQQQLADGPVRRDCQWAAKFPRLWAFNFPWFGGFGFDR